MDAHGRRTKECDIDRLTPNLTDVGGKGANLAWLIERNEPVPVTWVVRAGETGSALSDDLNQCLDPEKLYAVRSSANVEDGTGASYAGQFASELDVAIRDVPSAIGRTRHSAGSTRVAAYRSRLDGETPISISVIVQEMVRPVVSGVAFSRNPMTGLNEVVIEAVAGRGDSLVGEGVTPHRWVFRWGGWVEQSDSDVLPAEALEQIAADTARIAESFGSPVDLEWVWDGHQIWWVQLRPITGLETVSIYSNRISREVMPGIIKPLVWSVNVPMVNRAWVELFTEAIGPNDIQPGDLARAFAYRSYFNMGAIGDIFARLGMPRDSLELLLGLNAGDDKPSFKPTLKTMRLLPRMLGLAARKARYGRSVVGEVASLQAAYSRFQAADLVSRSDSALLSDVSALRELGVRSAYANIVTPLLANLYNTLLRQRLAREGIDPESVEIWDRSQIADLDPNIGLEQLSDAIGQLGAARIAEIRAGGLKALPESIRTSFDDFLNRFGHFSASGNDFSVAPWRETPETVLNMAIDHAATRGGAARVEWESVDSQLGVVARPLLNTLRKRAQQFAEHRESVSFTYTYGYGVFRRYFREIGRRLVDRRVLVHVDDIMYLDVDEVRAALLGHAMPISPRQLIRARRADIEQVADIVMPEIIYGDDFVPVSVGDNAVALSGIPTSRGHHRGTLRVVRGTEDFAKVAAGDVIAIPYSDVGWTPLFARAGAVVAAAGGILSHSSIVAREYQIPCVVSVEGAMQLPDGATVTVDGYAGTIVVDGEPQARS